MNKIVLIIIFIIGTFQTNAQNTYIPTKENLQAREWGLYSYLAGGGKDGYAEWIQNRDFIPTYKYAKLQQFFNPIEYNPVKWVKMAKDAGMKYIVFTSKHHEGFSMYDTKYSDFKITNTPYGKDVLKMLKEECDKQGIKLFVYYSLLDWHHPDYYPWGRSGREYTKRPKGGDWNKYIEFMKNQLTELLTNYGEIGGVFFDGWWDRKDANWHLDELYALIHKLQPQAMITNNHHVLPKPGEDYQGFERDLPGANTFGHNTTDISKLPLETYETMNKEWGYNFLDTKAKSAKEIINLLVRAAGNNANLLLNTGPMPNGKIVPENIESLKKVGDWMKIYGNTIYNTTGGPIKPEAWGAITKRDNKLFVHILDYKNKLFVLPSTIGKINKAYWFVNKNSIEIEQKKSGIIFDLGDSDTELIDRVIVIELEK